MNEVMEFMLECYSGLLAMLGSQGGIIGMFIICFPLLIWIVRSVRSIISKKH